MTLTANASDNIAVANVQFNVDGTPITTVSSSPYTTVWSSTAVADGSHTLTATAKDTSGNTTTSAGVAVTVRNTPPIISSIASSSIASTTQTITWTTDEVATSTVYYGTTTSYGTASSSAVFTTSHSITLTGLTASTTYYFKVSSTDAVGNTASSTNQSFTTAAYTYYVDSVNGSDSNPGTSPSLAFKNITALPTINAGQSVGLASGSYWRQELAAIANNVKITSYGSGALPILDGSDVVANATFTKTGGYTNVYNTATLTFGYSGANAWINVWETGGAGDSATGKFLQNVASIALVDSTSCSYYISGMTTSGTPTSAAIYIHSCDGTSPIANGYTYEYANRRSAVYINGTNGIITGIEGRKSAVTSGPFDIADGSSGHFTLNNVIARDCNDHCIVAGGGTTVENSLLIDGYWSTLNATLLVFYEPTASGQQNSSVNNIFQFDQAIANSAGMTGIISHTGDSSTMAQINSTNDWFIAKNGTAGYGFSVQYTSLLNIVGAHASQMSQFVSAFTNISVSNTQAVSDASSNTQYIAQANNLTLTFSGDQTCTSNDAHQVGFGTGMTINDSGSTWYLKAPYASTFDTFEGSSAALTINNDTFDNNIAFVMYPYNLYGTSATFTGGTTSGTANSYNATDNTTRFVLNNTTYNSLSAWQTAVNPQDSSAVTTRSGAGACTLPTIPTVN